MTQSLVYYKVTIDTPIADEDLIMMVKPTNRISDPDIFISKINPFPNSFENEEWVCNAFGLDICVINSKNIEPNTTFYVGVSCFQNCQYSLLAEYNT